VLYPFFRYEDFSNNGSFNIGGLITIGLSEKVGITTGIHYESKDFQQDYKIDDRSIPESWKKQVFDLKYLNFPIISDITLLKIESNWLSLNAGFELWRLLSYDIYVEYLNGTIFERSGDFTLDKFVHNFILGVSYRYIIHERFLLGVSPIARYNLSNSQGIHGDAGEGTALSFAIQFSIGYKLK
jgi:hypothetical protein